MSVQKQWDVGVSGFGISAQAFSLIKAATVDDVQPTTVIAAEAIGDTMIVDRRLIGRAVKALGGNKSFRLENIRLQVGLSSGGIVAQFRGSTAATRCFLLITGLRLLEFTKDESAEVLYEMLLQTSLLDKMPVSEDQLATLISILEGHAAIFLDVEPISKCFMDPLFDYLSQHPSADTTFDGPQELFERPPPSILASVLTRVFHALQSQDVSSLIVRGRFGSAWLLSILCWICPNDIDVWYNDTRIFGANNGKIVVDLRANERSKWQYEERYHLTSLESLFWQSHAARMDPSAQRGWGLPRDTIYRMLLSTTSLAKTQAIGQLVLGLLCASYDGLSLTDMRFGLKVLLKDVCTPHFAMGFQESLKSFGWPPVEDYKRVNKIREYFSMGSQSMPNSFRRQRDVRHWYSMHFAPFLGDELDLPPLDDEAMSLAIDMASCCVTEALLVRSVGFGHFMTKRDDDPSRKWLLDALLTREIPLEKFLANVIYHSDPAYHRGLRQSANDTLIVSGGGTVLYPRALLYPSDNLWELLAFDVIPGQLSFKDRPYPSLVEPPRDRHSLSRVKYTDALAAIDSAQFFHELDSPPRFSIRKEIDFLMLETRGLVGNAFVSFSSARQSLVFALRPQVTSKPERQQQNLDFIRSKGLRIIDPGDNITPPWFSKDLSEVQALTERYKEQTRQVLSTSGVRLRNPESIPPPSGFQGIIPSFGSASNDFYRASTPFSCFPMVIQGDASMDECIVQASEKFGDIWMILASSRQRR